MKLADFIMFCVSDYGGQMRGKGFPAWELDKRLASGIGIAPTAMMITVFNDIVASPWGSRGEILMQADPATETAIDRGDEPSERFFICDLTELDGSPWDGCPRTWARRGLEALAAETGLILKSAFEHEFNYSGAEAIAGDGYLLDAMRVQGKFSHALLHALASCGIEPENYMPEYGSRQFEITCRPALGLAAADRAVKLREIARSIARAYGYRACFAPVMENGGVGNGVHLHYSLQTQDGTPVTYDASRPHNIGEAMGQFTAGVLRDLPSLVALTAASAVSYERMKPHRWSPTVTNLGLMDRESAIRICPISGLPGSDPAKSANFEYRCCDAAASPYMVLGAVVWAGLQGIRDKLPAPEPTTADPETLSSEERTRLGIRSLPHSLEAALENLENSARAQDWLGPVLMEAYRVHKQSELKVLEGLSPDERIARYVSVY
ncbi:MAG: glutamine synthetase [Rhodospirillales bacterium]|nr:glutamine synthetase [Rhodospirillales bacterium]